MKLPFIPPTYPGELYSIRIANDRLAKAKLLASRLDLLELCAIGYHCPVICELGVYKGDFSRDLLRIFKPSVLFLMDTNVATIAAEVVQRPDVIVRQGISWEMLAGLPDESLDYIYIDADHSYHAVHNDTIIAHRKVKVGGIIQFNDYTTFSPGENIQYGVLNVVNSYIENTDCEIVGLSLDRSGYHDIAVRKCSSS